MNALSNCPQCGSVIPPESPAELCPRCLLAAGFESDAAPRGNASVTTPHSGSGRRFVPPTPAELAAHFPQLEILGLVGAGGMGAVYKARQTDLDRIVALKILPPQLGEDPAFAERFTREARAMARLSHPNIVSIFDFGRAGRLYYFTMEFVDGSNLRQVIKAEKVEPSDAVVIATQVCDALQYAHDEGVLHRDIKPENILVSRLGRAKLTDFGLAKIVLDAAQECSLTATRELLGTFRYMAPEQLEGSKVVDHRADIYALGIVLYELLTGEVPMGRFAMPSEKGHGDTRLDAVVLKALEREPGRRFQSAGEVQAALESLEPVTGGHGGHSTLTSRWTSGMFSGVWSATTSRPSGALVVACRVLGMLVTFAGVLTACFLTWQSVHINLIDTPPNWSSQSTTIAYQSSMGWQTLPGKLVAAIFGALSLHILSNLHRLRWLRPTFGAFLVCGFAVIAVSTWSIMREPALSGGFVRWQDSEWQVFLQNNSTPQASVAVPQTPRAYLESLAADAESPESLESLSHVELIGLLEQRGRLSISGSHWADAPYVTLGLGVAVAFVGLLEFVFTYAAEPARRLFGSARSSVSSRWSRQSSAEDARISKMAVLAALLAALPLFPLGFLLAGVLQRMSAGEAGYYGGLADEDSMLAAAGAMVGMGILPTTIGLFALYRIRRWHGLLHGLPLAYTASVAWPLVTLNVIVIAVYYVLLDELGTALPFALSSLVMAVVGDVWLFLRGWQAAKQPLTSGPRPEVS